MNENNCYICFKPATNTIKVIVESGDGRKIEEHHLCQFHKKELDIFKRKNAGRKEF